MHWIAPSEKDTATATLEKRLWDAAEQAMPASHLIETVFNSARPEGLLGLIFLRFAEVRFAAKRAQLESPSPLGGERAGVRGDSGHPRPSDGRGAGGEAGRFDFVLANPPFDINAVDAANCEVRSPKCESRSVLQSTFLIRHSRRLWIQLFHSALNEKGRAAFVLANSAFDARSSEQELRRQLIEKHFWHAADQFRANSDRKSLEYPRPSAASPHQRDDKCP